MDLVSAHFQQTTWGTHPFVEKNEFEYPASAAVGSSEHSKIFWKVQILKLEDLLKFLEQPTLIHRHYKYSK